MSSTCLPCLIIRLVIQTIRRDPSGSVQTDEAINVSRPDPSGADRTGAERQATQTDEAINVSRPDPSGADRTGAERQATDLALQSSWSLGCGCGL
jgi:hypothetical protein